MLGRPGLRNVWSGPACTDSIRPSSMAPSVAARGTPARGLSAAVPTGTRGIGHMSAYYREDLALVHHLGFGFHADDCAPGILALLEPVRARRGLVLELGC